MKTRLLNPLALATLLICVSCRSRQVVITPNGGDARSVGQSLAPRETPARFPQVRQSEAVKVYGVNRYVDPADPNLMHERHAMYRVEQQPGWITQSHSARNEVLLGPIVGLHRPEYSPEPQPGEAAREMMHAREGLQQTTSNIQNLQDSQLKLAGSMEALAKQTAEAQQKLTTIVNVLNQRVRRLENDGSTTVEAPAESEVPPISATVRAPQ